MTANQNLDLFQRIHTAFSSGDMDALAREFAPDIVWHTPGRHQLSGDYAGREATIQSFEREGELCNGTYRVDIRDVLVNDDHVVAFLRATARRGAKELDQAYIIVFAVQNQRVAAAWEIWSDQAAVDDFWA